MTDLALRFATAADVPAVAALIELAYRGPAAATGWTTETELLTGPRSSPPEVAALVADRDSRFVLAERTAEPRPALVGCALVQGPGDPAYFGMFAVDPAAQAGGVGRAVLAACERTARDLWAATAMRLSVISRREDLIAWYERRGYVRTGRRLPFPFHPDSGALRTDFDLVELRKALAGATSS